MDPSASEISFSHEPRAKTARNRFQITDWINIEGGERISNRRSRIILSNSPRHDYRDEKRPKRVLAFFGILSFTSHTKKALETPVGYRIVSILSEEKEFPIVVVDRTRI